jgi:hypothetical protein
MTGLFMLAFSFALNTDTQKPHTQGVSALPPVGCGEECPLDDAAFVAAIEGCHSDCLEYLVQAGHRPEYVLKLTKLENEDQLACSRLAESFGLTMSPYQVMLAASVGNLKLVRALTLGFPGDRPWYSVPRLSLY